ncbi:MAG: NUDIX domain-containing protein [archaeon]
MAKIGIKTRVSLVMFHKNKLVVTKHDVKGYGVYYLLPGGGIEHAESPEEAIKREALEECGLEVNPGRLLWIKSGYTDEEDYLDLIYLVEIKGGNFEIHEKEKMVKKIEFIGDEEELSKIKFFPKQIADKIFKELPKKTEYLGKFKYPEE